MAFSKPQFVPCACRDLFLTDSRKPLSCALLFFHCTNAFFSSQYQVCFIPNMYFSVSEVFMVVFFTANQVVSLYLCTRPLVKVLGRSHSDSILIFYCKFSFILLERHMGLPPELCWCSRHWKKSKPPDIKQTSLPLPRDKGKTYKRRDLQTTNRNWKKSWLWHLLGSHQEVKSYSPRQILCIWRMWNFLPSFLIPRWLRNKTACLL